MKKITFKTHLQWHWFVAALLGVGAGMVLSPASTDALKNIYFGKRYKVMIDGDVVALSKSKEAAEEAYKAARLEYNAKGIRPVYFEVVYDEMSKEERKELKDMKLAEADELTAQILDGISQHDTSKKELAYTMRIDEYTVTTKNMETLVGALEQTQEKYDENNAFQVVMSATANQNVSGFEVAIDELEQPKAEGASSEETVTEEASTEQVTVAEEATSEVTEESSEKEKEDATVEKEASEEGETEEVAGDAENEEAEAAEDKEADSEETAEGKDEEEQAEESEASEEEASEDVVKSDTEETDEKKESEIQKQQAVNDGIKYVGFSEPIQVTQTYVNSSQIRDEAAVVAELTAEHEEPGIYVVKPGDCLEIIAEKNNMTEDQLKELNPDVQSDENLYYDDRLNIVVPATAVQVLVKKQVTYEEKYVADTVYEDDADMFIGESEVVQEGSEGTHIVTDLVTYTNDLESGREMVEENVEVAAVAQIVKRGTKSKPTYMYPVTNWAVTSNYGYRWGRLHAGTDVGVPTGTTVRASRAGQVVTAGWVGGYGNCVMIDHGDGIWTVYGHLSEITTSVGAYVDQGDQIALSGNTGRSTGPHLHFEVRVNGSAVDATPYLEGTAD